MNTFGRTLRMTIFGESHGKGVGAVLDGVVPGTLIDKKLVDNMLERRRPSNNWESQRIEQDNWYILSGMRKNRATGAPLTFFIENSDKRPEDYNEIINNPRPGHADVTADIKYRGFNDKRGGGMFSGRMTAAMVASAGIVRNMIPEIMTSSEIEGKKTGTRNKSLRKAEKIGETMGGIISCVVKGVEPGLGEPFFYSMESAISSLIFSIPGVTGIEFGAGFRAAQMYGSEYSGWLDSDMRLHESGCGGINGGITNGNDIIFRVAMRPPATLTEKTVKTARRDTGDERIVVHKGRHDVSFVERAAVVVESCALIAAADMVLSDRFYDNIEKH